MFPCLFRESADSTEGILAPMSKRILFLATDPVGSESIRADLAAIEAGWETPVVGTFDEAVDTIEAQPVDTIVADHHVTDASGAKLLNWAAEHRPKAARLIMAEAAEREQVLRIVLTPHHFLAKPVAPDVLRGTIQSALLLDRAMPNEVPSPWHRASKFSRRCPRFTFAS
jgi:DNA-binding NarL/FixJ family response regulator